MPTQRLLNEKIPLTEHGVSDEEMEYPLFSVIVPISERHDDLKKYYYYYSKVFKDAEKKFEFIFVVNEGFDNAIADLKEIKKINPEIRVIKLNADFGEATALSVGFKQSRGNFIITLHPYFQIEPEGINVVMETLGKGYDLVITRRYPRVDSVINRVQTYAFHWLVNKLTGMSFHDMSCGLRGMKKSVAVDINLYGDLHRFIPLLAQMQGVKIAEVDVKQSTGDSKIRVYNPGVYFRRLLDILSVFFLFKFTKKPLRFFGLIGMSFFAAGFFINLYISIERVIEHIALANRPLLLLGVLAMVLGIQIASIGLLGEIIIFTHARETKDYKIEEILE